jgi:hypothetical protein
MDSALSMMKDHHLLALYRGGWKRCRAFFRHPRDVIALRAEVERRGLSE